MKCKVWSVELTNKKRIKSDGIIGIYSTRKKANEVAKKIDKEMRGCFGKEYRNIRAMVEVYKMNETDEMWNFS